MNVMTAFATHLARLAGHAGSRHPAHLISLALAGLVTLALAFVVGVLLADLLMPAPEGILAAPFRW